MQTITIVLEGGLVQSVYAADSHTRVIVLDLDIEGSDPDDLRVYSGDAGVREHIVESYESMPDEDRKALEKFLIDN